jgi:CO/xanthine dehydrogenase FAD-binding subunit
MIKDYFRPKTIPEALDLLARGKDYVPFGGGSTLQSMNTDIFAVDLQDLYLGKIVDRTNKIAIGATTTLESLLENYKESKDFSTAISIEASKNQRVKASVAGLVCSADGRSPLLTLLSALDLKMLWQPGNIEIPLGDWLPLRNSWSKASLITQFAMEKNIKFRFESVGRSPMDVPIICLAICIWPSSRMRVVAGGFGKIPTLILDGNRSDDIDIALEIGLNNATDQWASNTYRIDAAKKLAKRMLIDLSESTGMV